MATTASTDPVQLLRSARQQLQSAWLAGATAAVASAIEDGATAAAAAGLLQRCRAAGGDGTVRAERPRSVLELALPAADPGLGLLDWLDGFVFAALAQHAVALAALCERDTVAACCGPAAAQAPEWLAACKAGAALGQADLAQPATWPAVRAFARGLAQDRGLAGALFEAAVGQSPPDGATDGAARPERARLVLQLAPRAVLWPQEAGWYLDLQGCPRAGRMLDPSPAVEDAWQRCSVAATDTTPEVHATFVLAPVQGPSPVSLALDAGQLMLLAERHASGTPSAASLAEAVAATDAALLRFGPGVERLGESDFHSPQGLGQWRDEPGRYTLTRLAAYRDALVAACPGAEAARELDAQARARQAMAAIEQIVTPMLTQLRGPQAAELLQTLRPQAEDYGRLFLGTAADVARSAYEAQWSRPEGIAFQPPQADQTVLRVFVAPAGMLRPGSELARSFPQGYAAIAPLLNPHSVWVCWKYTRPAETSGLAYDGLAWCQDHWVWLPKPFRVLAAAAAARG